MSRGDALAAHALGLLLVLLPFEPRRPAFRLGDVAFTWLEVAAALVVSVLLASGRARLGSLIRRPPPALACLALFAVAHLLAAATAPANRGLSLKFALRMGAMAGFAFAVASAAPRARHRGRAALVLAAALSALLACAEGLGVTALDPLLDRFRESRVVVGGTRRATAGSEYPNLAAVFLMLGLVALPGLLRSLRATLPVAGLLSLGLLFTYSRGALAAAAVGLAVLALVRRERTPTATLGALVAVSLTFATTASAFRLRIGGAGIESWYRAAYAPADGSLVLAPGESREVVVRVTNAGRESWTGDGAYVLGWHWYDPQGGGNVADELGVALLQPVPAGGEATLHAVVKAPLREGTYLLAWDLLHRHVGWFSRLGVPPGTVPVVVARVAPAEPPAPPPASALRAVTAWEWRPSRLELWSLALAMWRDRPWTGVGSDKFRWLYGPYAGRTSWDARVYANNAYLEVAATTGVVGLTAFLGALVTTLIGAWRRRLPEDGGGAPTWLALIAALMVHGLVDYTLAFTGHYLAYGFVIGAGSAPPATPGIAKASLD